MTTPPVIRWHLAPGWEGPPPPLEEWCAAGLAGVVKQAPHRTVWEVRLPGLHLHVKHYREGLGRRLRGARAAREFALTCEVARRGVPTLEALAWGEDGTASYLITRTLPQALELAELLQRPLPPRLRQSLARQLGEFLALAHTAGVRHDDLHPGNVLVCGQDGPRLHLIDLDAVRLGPPLSWPARRDNLVVLNRWFTLRFSATDRFRCWRAYSRAAALADERTSAREVEAWTRASLLEFVRRLDRRCLGGNRHFRRLRRPGLSGYAVADVDLSPLLADFETPEARTLKRSASSVVVERDLASRPVICKRLPLTGWSDPLAALVRPTPALRSYRMGHALRLRGLPTPRPLAVWHRLCFGLPTEGYLVVDRVPDAVDLAQFVRQRADPDRLRRLIEQLARLVRSLHRWQLSHRDLKAANVLVSPQGWAVGPRGLREKEADGDDHVWLVDLVGVRRHRRLGERRRAKDLARLNASFLAEPAVNRPARLRFLRVYLGRDTASWKTWWRRVEELTGAKVERNRTRGRPLT